MRVQISKLARTLERSQKQISNSIMAAAIFFVGFFAGTRWNIEAAYQVPLNVEEEQEFQAFWQAYNLLRNNYLDPIDIHLTVEGAINGMFDAQGDPYTGYMTSEVYPLLNEDISGEISGIGVVIRTLEDSGLVAVANVLKNTPAERAGVEVGDIFLAVDGEDVVGFNQTQLAGVVRGPTGSTVEIVFLRGEEEIALSIVRDVIPIPITEHRLLENNVGYVRLFEFTPKSREEIDRAIESMGGESALSGLILDLRGNPGGLLSSSISVTSAFLPSDYVVLNEEFSNRNEVLRTDGTSRWLNVPMILLVDETSASASELVSGALQDHERATIMGEVTFGKGTVQNWQSLSNGGGVRITIARWLTPDGNWIHEQGIQPDVLVEWNPEGGYLLDIEDAASIAGDVQLQAALAFLQEMPAKNAQTAQEPAPVVTEVSPDALQME